MTIDDRPSLGYRIERLLAYVAADNDGEGLIGATIPGLGHVPLVGADMDRMMSYRPYAVNVARATGREVTLVRFDNRVDVEVLR
jgi:hypothetical protein